MRIKTQILKYNDTVHTIWFEQKINLVSFCYNRTV